MFCIIKPGGGAAGHQVVNTGQRGSLCAISDDLANSMGGDVSNQIGPGRCAKLVVDDGEFVALLTQAQHGFGKVATAGGVDPAGTENQVARGMAGNQRLALQLAGTVDA